MPRLSTQHRTICQHGGALLLTAGPEFGSPESLDQTPLADVLPAHQSASPNGVIAGMFRPQVTALGARHPVTEGLRAQT